ncbi:MAG: hypothetical protein QM770_19180 [Tepidisphaeraceae bacterium]
MANKYGKSAGSSTVYNVITGTKSVGSYRSMARALVMDPPSTSVQGAKKAYVAHVQGNRIAFNMGYLDGSVRTAYIRDSVSLPTSGQYQQILAMVNYCEAIVDGGASGSTYNPASCGDIPYSDNY